MLAVGPQFLPRQDFRIVQEQPPEGNKVAVARPRIVPRCVNPLVEFKKSLARPRDINAALAALAQAILAEAGDGGVAVKASVARADGIIQRALPLRAPHDSIDL